MQKYKSIAEATWSVFVASLKQCLKEGYRVPHKIEYQHGFCKAVLFEGVDEVFAKKVDTLTGDEQAVLEIITELDPTTAKKTVENPVTLVETVAENDVKGEDVQSVAVAITKPKQQRKPRKGKDV